VRSLLRRRPDRCEAEALMMEVSRYTVGLMALFYPLLGYCRKNSSRPLEGRRIPANVAAHRPRGNERPVCRRWLEAFVDPHLYWQAFSPFSRRISPAMRKTPSMICPLASSSLG